MDGMAIGNMNGHTSKTPSVAISTGTEKFIFKVGCTSQSLLVNHDCKFYVMKTVNWLLYLVYTTPIYPMRAIDNRTV